MSEALHFGVGRDFNPESDNHFITGNNDRSTGGKNRHCTETTTTKIARYIWLKHCSTTKPHAKLKGERS